MKIGECLLDASSAFLTFVGFKKELTISTPFSSEWTLQFTVVGHKHVTRRYLDKFSHQNRA
jgi:hypothetical protein